MDIITIYGHNYHIWTYGGRSFFNAGEAGTCRRLYVRERGRPGRARSFHIIAMYKSQVRLLMSIFPEARQPGEEEEPDRYRMVPLDEVIMSIYGNYVHIW